MNLKAIIFDLDGVLTDTAEYHYRAWQRLADEEGLPFDRALNEQLRGVSRRGSLDIMLANAPAEKARKYDEAQREALAERKNEYYVAMLEQISPDDLLPGALPLLRELRAAGIKLGIGSASKNTGTVLDRLGITDLLDAVADGYSFVHGKPAPDVFLKAAELLGVAPAFCAVFEDAAVGIDAALAAKMWAIGVGPVERVGHTHARFDSLEGVTLAKVLAALEDAAWTVAEPAFDPAHQHHRETVFTIGNGNFSRRGAFEEGYPGDKPGLLYALLVGRHADQLHRAGQPAALVGRGFVGQRRALPAGPWSRSQLSALARPADGRTLARQVRWQPAEGGPVLDLRFERFVEPGRAGTARGLACRSACSKGEADLRLRTGFDAHVENTGLVHWRPARAGRRPGLGDADGSGHTRRSTSWRPVSRQPLGQRCAWTGMTSDADGQPAVERRVRLATRRQPRVSRNTSGWSSSVGLLPSRQRISAADGLGAEAATDRPRSGKATARGHARAGFDAVLAANELHGATRGTVSDVLVEGDIEAQLALRFNIFQLLIAAPRYTDHASIGAKTLSGFGYRHHVFWDTEIFMLPLFTFTQPALARNMLMYRWHNLPAARDKARANGYEGAQFPWESAGDGARGHADLGAALCATRRGWSASGPATSRSTSPPTSPTRVMQYWQVTGDDAWMRDYGAEIDPGRREFLGQRRPSWKQTADTTTAT